MIWLLIILAIWVIGAIYMFLNRSIFIGDMRDEPPSEKFLDYIQFFLMMSVAPILCIPIILDKLDDRWRRKREAIQELAEYRRSEAEVRRRMKAEREEEEQEKKEIKTAKMNKKMKSRYDLAKN